MHCPIGGKYNQHTSSIASCGVWFHFPFVTFFSSLLDDVAVSHCEYTMRQRWIRCQTCSSCVLPFVWNFCETTHSTATMLTIWAMVSLPTQKKTNKWICSARNGTVNAVRIAIYWNNFSRRKMSTSDVAMYVTISWKIQCNGKTIQWDDFLLSPKHLSF